MPLTVLEGSTFCICDERGDVDGSSLAAGLFASDTRFLSRSVLTLGGRRPEPLAHAQPAPHRARFTLRNAVVEGLEPNELSIERERFVGYGMEERIAVVNHAQRRVEAELALELDADFADIFTVKDADEGFAGMSGGRTLCRPLGEPAWDGNGTLAFADDDFPARTLVHLSRPGAPEGKTVRFALALQPGERWELVVGVQPLLDGTPPLAAASFAKRILDDRREAERSLEAWQRTTPRLSSPWNDLVRTWDRSLADLAALRMHGDDGFGTLPAAGTPWFMTVFGRDTLITCLQTLVCGPDLAESALRTLAATQADMDDPERDAEPGKIVHEIRRGKAALAWTDRYYGSVDATPLFLILLSELWRWTGDPALARELEQPARRALAWIDGPGDRDGDGFVEYGRRARRNGILHQSWKDSEVSMAFADGSPAVPPIAPAEVQGYVYDAKLRAAELAREVWGDGETAARLEQDAAALRERFDRAFWLGGEAGGYALGLDRDKRPIDTLTSNVGHLLWSGIVPPERVAAVADVLMGERLWSGWGVRTMAAGERAYNPLVYHNGTVWPHDNSLIAWGLARAGRGHDVERILRSMVEAAAYFDYRLPEVFAGFPRRPGEMPIPYPTASRPQAWAAGAPVLLLRLVLGLEPDPVTRTLRSDAAELPGWAENLELRGVGAFGRRWNARVEGGRVGVEESRPVEEPSRFRDGV